MACGLKEIPSLHYNHGSLQLLVLEDNQIAIVPQDYFNGWYSMTFISLQNNNLTSMPNLAGVAATIEEFSVSGNNIDTCSSLCDMKFPKLKLLYLSRNHLVEINLRNALNTWLQLLVIQLDGNRLTCLQDLTMLTENGTDRSEIVQVYADSNPWDCNHLLWLTENFTFDRDDVTTRRFGWITMRNVDRMICAQPKWLQNRSMLGIGKL